MTYYIEYTNIPTRHNTRQTIETNNPQLFVAAFRDNELSFTDYAKRNLNICKYGALISRIYKEDLNKNQIEILYKYQGHFGERLKLILKPIPTEVFV
jgi:hypothetical protein